MSRGLLFVAVAIAAGFCGAEEVPLSSLNLKLMRQGYGQPQINKSFDGTSLTIAGRTFERGVGTHAPGRMYIELDGKAERFHAWVGVDATAEAAGSVEFEVMGDGRQLFKSGVMKSDTAAIEVSVPLAGVNLLTLKVGDAGDGQKFDHADWADSIIVTSGTKPEVVVVPSEPKIILTPKPGPEPRINAPVVYGCRPGNPFLYRIPATGTRPMTFKADALPPGLSLDAFSGIVSGVAPVAGDHDVVFHASNSDGSTSKSFTIKSGDTISLTPYMGWNHWYAHYQNISDKKMREAADAMVSNGMADFGYAYVAIDDCWSRKPGSDDPALMGEPRDEKGNILTNQHFPDMKGLTDYIHAKGLKAGIYSSPGPLTCENFAASYNFEAQDARQFAEWGFDLLKYDWCTYGKVAGRNPSLEELKKPYEIMGPLVKGQDRDIIFNLCQYGRGNVWQWGADVKGQSWRTSGDLGFALDQIFQVAAKNVTHRAWNGPGRWNDPDYLQIGFIGGNKMSNTLMPAPLTPTEQYSFMSLWCLMASPLVYSGDITRMDEFTLNVLCNAEVIEVNQDPLGQCAAIADLGDESFLLVKEMADGSKAVGLCNGSETTATLTAEWSVIGVEGEQRVRDLWIQKDIGTFDLKFEADVPRHGVKFVRLFKE